VEAEGRQRKKRRRGGGEREDEDYRKGGEGRRRLKQSKRVGRIVKRGRRKGIKKEERSVRKV
jgi:hypothetical protein